LFSINEDEYVIAKDEADVLAVLHDLKYDTGEPLEIEMWPDDEPYKFQREEGNPASVEAKLPHEWAAEFGRGYFACSA